MNHQPTPIIVVSSSSLRRERLVSRGWGRPPGMLLNGLAKLWLVAVIYYTSNVAMSLGAYGLLFGGLLLLGGAWILLLVVHLMASVAGGLGPADRRRRRFITLPMVVAVAAACFMFRPALMGRLLFSQVGLTLLTDFKSSDEPEADEVVWRGLFQISDLERMGPSTRFITYAHHSDDRAGLAHCPSGGPSVFDADRYEFIFGEWWAWYPDETLPEPAPTIPPA